MLNKDEPVQVALGGTLDPGLTIVFTEYCSALNIHKLVTRKKKVTATSTETTEKPITKKRQKSVARHQLEVNPSCINFE